MTIYIVKVGSGMVVEKDYSGIGTVMLDADERKAKVFTDLASAGAMVAWLHDHGVTQAIVWRVSVTAEEAVVTPAPILHKPTAEEIAQGIYQPVAGGLYAGVTPYDSSAVGRAFNAKGVTPADTPTQ